MSIFQQISRLNVQAYISNQRGEEILSKKQEILNDISDFYELDPTNILFIGFSSFVFAEYVGRKFITDIDDETYAYLESKNVQCVRLNRSDLARYHKQFDVVVAADEFFTYAQSDEDQRQLVKEISDLSCEYVITTLRDYKNQDYRDREFSFPINIKSKDLTTVFLESHDWSISDRNAWKSKIYQIDPDDSLTVHGPFDRRAMYFKQLAKFSSDAGASGFLVHKNLMYKGLCRKNYEHVITMRFENANK
jgi:hypothetical protein